MTKEEWQQIEQELLTPFSTVKLKIDGYEIDLFTIQHKLKLLITVCIDGKLQYKNCEDYYKFYWCRTKCIIPQKELKNLDKKHKQEMIERYTYKYYYPYFDTFRTLKRTFVKNNTNIQIINTQNKN